MTTSEDTFIPVGRYTTPPATEMQQKELVLVHSIGRLTTTLDALRLAINCSGEAAGVLCIVDDGTTVEDGLELRRRWSAAHTLMLGAVTAAEVNGTSVVDAVKALLSL